MKNLKQHIGKRVRFKWHDGREDTGILLEVLTANNITIRTDRGGIMIGPIMPGTLELEKQG